MRRVVILTGSHICHNPRAFKEAETLAAAGYDIEWYGAWFDPELAERDRLLIRDRNWRFTAVTDWTSGTLFSEIRRQTQRSRRWLGLKLHKLFGQENCWQLGYCTPELFRAARKRTGDLFIAHSEPAMWVADKLRRRGRRVGVDIEDWFSEDLLPGARRNRPLKLIRGLEKSLLNKAAHRTCTSNAMSSALASTYSCKPPAAIYNVFPWKDRKSLDNKIKDRVNHLVPSLHWFSQTVGPGRGLEDLFSALPMLSIACEIHIRGNVSTQDRKWLNSLIPLDWKSRVLLHPVVHNDELLSRIAEHDVGLALEPVHPRNKDLTASNKIFAYLLAGLAVVGTNTGGHTEVATQAPGAVFLYKAGDAADLAKCTHKLLFDKQSVADARKAALLAAEQIFCWERVSPRLIESVRAAVDN
jgi:glycosyltransferase involved in cell wall biosynthesis